MEKETFVINLLEDEDFDKLDYQNISDDLGFADPESGNVFIRKTHVPEIDMLTIQHEIQELISKESFHEDANGIRHKKVFKEILLPIISTVVGSVLGGPVGGAIGGAAGSAGGQTLAGQKVDPLKTVLSGAGGYLTGGAMAPGVAASKAAGGGVLGQTLSGLQGAVGITPGATAGKQVATAMGKPVTFGQTIQGSNVLGSVLPGAIASGFPTPAAAGLTPAMLAQTGGVGAGTLPQLSKTGTTPGATPPIGGVSGIGGTPGGVTATPNVAPAKAPLSIKDLVTPQNILGATSVLGSMGGEQPEYQPPVGFEELKSKLMTGGGLTPLATQAQTELGRIMASKPEDLYPADQDAYLQKSLQNLEDRRKDEMKQLEKRFNLAGMGRSGEMQAELNNLTQYYDDLKQQVTDQSSQRKFEFAQNQKYQAVQSALGVNANEMNALLGLTGWDVKTAANAFNAKTEDVTEIRRALGTLGAELILRGTPGLQQPVNVNVLGSPAMGG